MRYTVFVTYPDSFGMKVEVELNSDSFESVVREVLSRLLKSKADGAKFDVWNEDMSRGACFKYLDRRLEQISGDR